MACTSTGRMLPGERRGGHGSFLRLTLATILNAAQRVSMSICFITDEAECLPEATLKSKGLFWLTVHHGVGNPRQPGHCTPMSGSRAGRKARASLTFSYVSAPHHRPQSDTDMFRGSTSTSINTGQKITGRHSFPQACLLGHSRAACQVDNISHHTTEGGKVKR